MIKTALAFEFIKIDWKCENAYILYLPGHHNNTFFGGKYKFVKYMYNI